MQISYPAAEHNIGSAVLHSGFAAINRILCAIVKHKQTNKQKCYPGINIT